MRDIAPSKPPGPPSSPGRWPCTWRTTWAPPPAPPAGEPQAPPEVPLPSCPVAYPRMKNIYVHYKTIVLQYLLISRKKIFRQ